MSSGNKNIITVKLTQIVITTLLLCMSISGKEVLATSLASEVFQNYSQKDIKFTSEFKNATIQKNQLWELNNFDLFSGNNLNGNAISTKTNTIKITRKSRDNFSTYVLYITDMNKNVVYSNGTIFPGGLETVLSLKSQLESNKTYMIFIQQINTNAVSMKGFPIGYFTVDQQGIVQSLKPKINDVLDTDQLVTGVATPNTTIYLTMGMDNYRGEVNSEGFFSINLDQRYSAGTSILAYSVDKNGSKSESSVTIVKASLGDLGVNVIYSSDAMITGKTISNVLLEASIENQIEKARIFEGTSDSNGYYTIDLRGKTYPAGTQITVTAFKSDGTRISKNVIVYPKLPSINTVHEGDYVVTGLVDLNATVEIIINDTNKYRIDADSTGKFRLPVDKLYSGDKISIFQESHGVKSDVITISVQ